MSHPLLVSLEPGSRLPMHRQLSDAVREAIVQNRLKPGTRLPSTRALAEELHVSRNTTLEAFAQLRAEGYVEARTGSGSYVATALPERTMSVTGTSGRRLGAPRFPATVSQRGRLLLNSSCLASCDPPGAKLAFDPTKPADDLFPAEIWRRLVTCRWLQHPDPTLLAHGSGGYPPLREAIARYVCASRGLACEPEQVIVIGGERQGLDLATRVLMDPGDPVWFEDPGSPDARKVLALAGADVVPIPVDDDGLDVVAGIRTAPDARMVYVSPSLQYPLARTLTLERRAALLEWAGSRNAWVLEDDRDSEFRYSGRPLPALHGIDAAERVIYMGGFSRVLGPALRVAYLVVPRSLVDVFVAAGSLTDRDPPTIEQAVLADFLAAGHFARHLRRLRAAYDHRRSVLIERVEARLGGLVRVAAAAAGMHVVAHLPNGLLDTDISARCAAANLVAPALSDHALSRSDLNGLLLGFAGYSDPAIRYGARRLAEIVGAAWQERSSGRPQAAKLAA